MVPGTPEKKRCPFCPTRPGCSEVARLIYGVTDAPCEKCNETGYLIVCRPSLPPKDPS